MPITVTHDGHAYVAERTDATTDVADFDVQLRWYARHEANGIYELWFSVDGTCPHCPNIRADFNGELPDIPEREPRRLPFDPMQPLELSDGTPVRIDRRDTDDKRMEFRVRLLETSACGQYGDGHTFWADNLNDGRVYEGVRLQNVDLSVPAHVRKARRDFARVPADLKPDFLDAEWFAEFADIHFPTLVERDEVAMVSFFENERKLEADRRTEMRVGRYVRRFNGGKLKDEEVEQIAASSDVKLRGNRVKITQDADEIEEVYVNGPNSCMSGDVSDYDTDGIHPSRVYAGPDLAIAYIGETDDASSRCVVWPEEKRHGRIYGDETRMAQMLSQLGYSSGSMVGARVQLIECDQGIVMPYVDGICGAAISGSFVKLGRGSDVSCSETNGLGSDNCRTTCDSCDDTVHQEDVRSVYSSRYSCEEWCESCRSEATYCDYAGEYVRDDCMVEVVTSRGLTDSCAEWELDRNDFVRVTAGEHDGEYVHIDQTGEHDGEVYHIDDLPEDADADDAPTTLPPVTVAEAEAAGQMALPLDATGEFKLMVTSRTDPTRRECQWNVGSSGENRFTGTYAECEATVRNLQPRYPQAAYEIVPVADGVTLADAVTLALAA